MRGLRKYLITLAVDILGVAAILWSKDIFGQTTARAVFHILTDAFFVIGFVTAAAGLLVFSTNEGTFDMLVYGVSSFVDMFRKTSRKKFDTFYDYRQSRVDSKIPFAFLLVCGAVFLAISFVMYYFYRQYA